MVTINGTLTKPDGSPEAQSFKVSLVDYGTTPSVLYHSATPLVVTPDPLTGQFSFDIWNDLSSTNNCYYRVQFESGLTFKIRVPESDVPLQLTSLIVESTPTGIAQGLLSRIAQLEAIVGNLAEGISITPTQLQITGLATSTPVDYTGTETNVSLPVTSISLPSLTAGGGLVVAEYDGSNPVTFEIDPTAVVTSVNGNAGSVVLTKTSLGLGNIVDVDNTNASNLTSGIVNASLVPTLNQSTTGNAATATKLETARLVNGITFDGTTDINLTKADIGLGSVPNLDFTNASNLTSGIVNASLIPTLNQSTTGNAATATRLATARLISGVAFDGTTDISLTKADIGLGSVPNLDFTNASNLATGTVDASLLPTLNQSTTGNAATATKLATARLINGVAFDGTADVTQAPLTAGTGLLTNSYNGTAARTFEIDTSLVVTDADSRLTNSREWIASTATQLQAEAGTATTRLAWSPVAVWQAIASWFNSSAFKTKLDTIATGANVNTVDSVSGKTGAVSLVKADVGLGNVANVDTTNASNIGTGTLSDNRLSANVALLTTTQNFIGSKVFNDDVKLFFGVDSDFRIQHSASTNFIDSLNGSITVRALYNSGLIRFQGYNASGSNRELLQLIDGECRLFGNSSLNLTTEASQTTAAKPLVVTSTTNATSTTSPAALKLTSGGIACAGDIYANKVSYTQSDVVTFTPSFNGTGWGYGTQYGRYIRTGRNLSFVIILAVTQIGTSGSAINGLPSSPITSSFFVNVRPSNLQNLPASYYFTPYIATNSQIVLEYTHGATATNTIIGASNYTTGTVFYIAGSYITAS